MTTKPLEIAIIGGGIAGLTLAIALHNRNINVHIYERAKHFREIGAGVSFSPNAVRAMKVCGDGVHAAFDKVVCRNLLASKDKVYFDFYEGTKDEGIVFPLLTETGQCGVQRWQFLDELSKQFPSQNTHFGHQLDEIETIESGRHLMKFANGSTAEADAIVGCDGIHSRVREIINGFESPSSHPNYTHKYAYRGLIPMDKAVKVLGEEKAKTSCNYVGPNGHVLTFPINNGNTMNVVAFYTDTKDWEDAKKLTKWVHRDDALSDFKDFGPTVTRILELVEPELNIWAIFELGNPVPALNKGSVLITGDAAHATSPHLGSGAGFAVEDSAFLAELLTDERLKSPKDLAQAFAIFDEIRRERGQWLVENSRFVGKMYDLEMGNDMKMIHDEMEARYRVVNGYNLQETCEKAKEELARKLKA